MTASTASLADRNSSPQRTTTVAGGFLSPAKHGETEFTERGSRFIGNCAPVSGEQEAKFFVSSVREKYPGASHTVFAYRLQNGASRLSDDGEPSGTAGSPVFEVLTRRDVVNAVITVTRYFGGTLLGAGGLIRAYAKAAAAALDAAGTAEMRPWRKGEVTVPYPLYEKAARLLDETGGRDVEVLFKADVKIWFSIPAEGWAAMAEGFRELTAGSAEPVETGDFYG
ncbi:MAG: YigZ family protein [Oscillospiraceae bacterium]|nr:YigZ family protein [Oscillospiraceae bacterium]